MKEAMKEHWNCIYGTRESESLGWYEKVPEQSLKLLSKCNIDKNESILSVGAGVSTFIDNLVDNGYKDISVVDISDVAMNKLRFRLGEKKSSSINWIVDDLTEPTQLNKLQGIALWHDRAVLHFLVEEQHRESYFLTLKKVVKVGGYVIIAAFSKDGAKKCSGLEIVNYDSDMMAGYLGDDFKLIEDLYHTHLMPNGEPRPYVYSLFQRLK
jgi:hypothetical protein